MLYGYHAGSIAKRLETKPENEVITAAFGAMRMIEFDMPSGC